MEVGELQQQSNIVPNTVEDHDGAEQQEEQQQQCNTQPVSIFQNISRTFRCILSVLLTRNNKIIACLFLPEPARNRVLVAFLEVKNMIHRVGS